MNIYYLTAGTVGLLLSFIGSVFALLSGKTFAYVVGGCLIALHIWSYFYAYIKASQEKPNVAMVALISPLFIVLFGGMIGSAVLSAPLVLLPTFAILLFTFVYVIRRARQRLAGSGVDLSTAPPLLESRFTLGEWLTLLSGSALAGYCGLLLYRHFYA
jgi:hypothetical protein